MKVAVLWPDEDYCEKNRVVAIDNQVTLDADQTKFMLLGFDSSGMRIGKASGMRMTLEIYTQPPHGFTLHRLPTERFKVDFKYLVSVIMDNTLHPDVQVVFCRELPDLLEFLHRYASVIKTILECFEAQE